MPLTTIPKFAREEEGVAIFRAYKTEVLIKLKKCMAAQWPLLPEWVIWSFDRVLNERKRPWDNPNFKSWDGTGRMIITFSSDGIGIGGGGGGYASGSK